MEGRGEEGRSTCFSKERGSYEASKSQQWWHGYLMSTCSLSSDVCQLEAEIKQTIK